MDVLFDSCFPLMSPSCVVLVMYALVLDGFRLFASGC